MLLSMCDYLFSPVLAIALMIKSFGLVYLKNQIYHLVQKINFCALPILTFVTSLSYLSTDISPLPNYLIIQMYALLICQCMQMSFAFSIILPEARSILKNVSFEEFPELNIYATTQSDEVKSFIIFKLSKSESISSFV